MTPRTTVTALWTAAAGLGAAGLTTLLLSAPLLSRRHLTIYHLEGNAEPYIATAAVVLLLVWAIAAACLGLIQSLPPLPRRALLTVFYMAVLLALIQSLEIVEEYPVARWQKLTITALAGLVLAALAAWKPRLFDHGAVDLQQILALCGILSAIFLAGLGWNGWQTRHLNPTFLTARPPPAAHPSPSPGKILWILFDELSYQQIYGHRAPGIDLPEFDRLARQSVNFTQVRPAGYYTEKVLPSLITGRRFVEIRSTSDGWPWFLPEGTTRWQPFDPQDTIFADAERSGLRVAIEGWYNPYCRIFLGVVDQCRWTEPEDSTHCIEPQHTLTQNFQSMEVWARQKVLGRRTTDKDSYIETHLDSYHKLSTWSQETLTRRDADVIFLHLPIPHPPGLVRRDGRPGQATYLDNLVLADALLGRLRQAMGPAWDDATVVVMGDHSWRVNYWKPQPDWTEEEQQASNGIFDDRPAYLVKLPHQQTPAHIDTNFQATRTRALFQEIFHAAFPTPADLIRWAQST